MSDTPMTGANEFDGDDDRENGFNGVNWRKITVLVLALAALTIAGFFAWNKYEEFQLPAAFTARPGDSLVTYVTSTTDPVERARIAVRAAELTRQPVLATERCGQSVQRVPGQCGRPQPVSYKLASKLASYTDTVMLNVPLRPGDFMDARNRVFIPAVRKITTRTGVTVYSLAN